MNMSEVEIVKAGEVQKVLDFCVTYQGQGDILAKPELIKECEEIAKTGRYTSAGLGLALSHASYAAHYNKELLAELEALKASLVPQPIADAPKDETHLLLLDYAQHGKDVYRGAWSEEYQCWMSYCGQPIAYPPEPTHFLRLPQGLIDMEGDSQ
jgi:hypothetical protein